MAPGTNAGAAHPVGAQGEDIESTMGEKVTNDASALIRSLAEARGRTVEWAEKAVDGVALVHRHRGSRQGADRPHLEQPE